MSLNKLFEEVCEKWISATSESIKSHPVASLIRNTIPSELNRLVSETNSDLEIKGSVGQGGWANVPWISLLNKKLTSSTQSGVYPVYLFKADGTGVYLSLGFGTTELEKLYGKKGAIKEAKTWAGDLRKRFLALAEWNSPIKLASNTDRGNTYEWASAGAKFYDAGKIPEDDDLEKDLKELLTIYGKIEKVDSASVLNIENELTMLPKPFILLAGISGTGKTRFVREQAIAHNVGDVNFCQIPVRPDWHEPSDLLGYVSRISGTKYIATKALKFIIDAWRVVAPNADKEGMGDLDLSVAPYWLCLDEMNLAPVEQYFADYLSVLESRKFENGKYTCEPLLTQSNFQMDIKSLRTDLGISDDEDGLWEYFSHHGIPLPPNIIVAGTVNMDETTHGFSRKVIDRACTLDFGEFFPNDYQKFFSGQELPKTFTYSQLTHASQKDLINTFDVDGAKTVAFLESINEVLKQTPFELAYRALNELLLHVACFSPQDEKELQAVWDDFLMTKVLPRIDGDDDKLRLVHKGEPADLLEVLVVLLESNLNEIWAEGKTKKDFFRNTQDEIPCRSRTKIEWMKNRLEVNTFTSFWP